eukprot:9132243-Alexandrium_andersonii.AAC.1
MLVLRFQSAYRKRVAKVVGSRRRPQEPLSFRRAFRGPPTGAAQVPILRCGRARNLLRTPGPPLPFNTLSLIHI